MLDALARPYQRHHARFETAIWMGCFGFILYTAAKFFLYAGYSFDTTDESYYILSALHSEDLAIRGTWFDYYIGLIWKVIPQSLISLRYAGILGLLLAFVTLTYTIALWARSLDETLTHWRLFAFLQIGTLFGLISYYGSYFLITPSYNWLTLIGILLAASGLFLYLARGSLVLAIISLSIGGFLAFAAKSFSGLFLLVAVLSVLAVHRCHTKKILFAATSVALAGLCVLAHMVILEGGINNSFDKMLLGKEGAALLDPDRTLTDVVLKVLLFLPDLIRFTLKHYLGTLLVTSLALYGLIVLQHRYLRKFAVLFVSSVWFLETWFLPMDITLGIVFALLVFCVAILSLLMALIRTSKNTNTDTNTDRGSHTPLILLRAPLLFIMIGILIFSIGTGTHLHKHAIFAAGLLAIAGLIILHLVGTRTQQVGGTSLFCLMLAVFAHGLSQHGLNTPYRATGPVQNMTHHLDLPAPIGQLRLTKPLYDYASHLTNIPDFKPGTRVIDLTGGSPGALVFLQARFVGAAWLLGGYSGSKEFISHVFSATPPAHFEDAWILTAPDGRRATSSDVLISHGIAFPDDYRLVTTVHYPRRDETQYLWAPLSDK